MEARTSAPVRLFDGGVSLENGHVKVLDEATLRSEHMDALVRQAVLAIPVETIHPLQIVNVESRVESHNGRDVLFVSGAAENRGAATRPLPPIEIAVIANDGAVTRYYLGTNETELTPGGRYAFSSRLEPPRNGVKIVAVTFQEVPH